jgi:hypothetical protein
MMRRMLAQPAGMAAAIAPRPIQRYGLLHRLLLSGFIAFHITATLLWLLPPSALRQALFSLPQQYISRVGLWQSWGMFAPEPSNLNLYLTATLSYRDGSQQSWTWPRPEQLDLLTRYQKERYRKFTEYGRLDAFSYLWPSMAQFAAKQLPQAPANPVVRVQLWRHWWFVPPPPAGGDLSQPPPHQWSQYLFYDSALPAQPAPAAPAPAAQPTPSQPAGQAVPR